MLLRFFLFCIFVCFLDGAAAARDMKLTIYDDGISCPAGCDAHVVMNSADNGTINGHKPGTRGKPAACAKNTACEICFSDLPSSCMTATFRGGGPPIGTFDFTPAFYDANCAQSDVPVALESQCSSLDRAAARLGYDKRVDCLAQPTLSQCITLIAAAEKAQVADVPKREACLKEGEASYNRRQVDPKERRTNECNYSEMLLGGTPSKRWHLLLPAACRPGTYVDQFGLDCCSKSVRFAAANDPECIGFFPN